MAAWHRSWQADLGLRLLGMALWAIAYLAIARLLTLRPPALPRSPGVVSYGLAAVGFLGASAGTACTVLGRHLFDEIEISERWRVRRALPPLDRTNSNRDRSASSSPAEPKEEIPPLGAEFFGRKAGQSGQFGAQRER